MFTFDGDEMKKDSYWLIIRREGALQAIDVFCGRNKLEWLGMRRYKLFYKIFNWYGFSKIGRYLHK